MTRPAVIEISSDQMKFAAAHFTIFSKELRENLHGHNYTVHAAITTLIDSMGITFDYRFYKLKLQEICKRLTQTTLLPANSPYLTIEDKGDYIHAHFNNETLIFLKRDALVLPISNVTLEELSNLILTELLECEAELHANKIQKIAIKVHNSPGRSGTTKWRLYK